LQRAGREERCAVAGRGNARDKHDHARDLRRRGPLAPLVSRFRLAVGAERRAHGRRSRAQGSSKKGKAGVRASRRCAGCGPTGGGRCTVPRRRRTTAERALRASARCCVNTLQSACVIYNAGAPRFSFGRRTFSCSHYCPSRVGDVIRPRGSN
jgi:hypothetical protein